jgi:hypothetical protein
MLAHNSFSLHDQLAESIECCGILIDGDMSVSLAVARDTAAGRSVSEKTNSAIQID